MSTNSGTSFASISGISSGNHTSCRMSSTGQYMLINTATGIFVSSNYGSSFASKFANTNARIACGVSPSGQNMISAIQNGAIKYSTNYGETWTSSAQAAANWTRCSVTDDGHACVTAYNVGVYYSSNAGQTWAASTGLSATTWYGICMSASGQYVTASSLATACYVSTNYGQSFTVSSTSASSFRAVACSPSGRYQIGGLSTYIYYSTDYGVTWAQSGSATMACYALAMSSTGIYILAGGYADKLYAYVYSPVA